MANRKTYRRNHHRSFVSNPSQLVPSSKVVKLQYESPIKLSTSTPTNNYTITWKLNNAGFPVQGTSGCTNSVAKNLSAQGFDIMQLTYTSCVAYGALVKLRIRNHDTVDYRGVATITKDATDVTTAHLVSDLASRPYARDFTIPIAAGSAAGWYLEKYYPCYRMFAGMSKFDYLNDITSYIASTASTTDNSLYLNLSFATYADTVPATDKIQGTIEITYYMRWIDPIQPVDQANLG